MGWERSDRRNWTAFEQAAWHDDRWLRLSPLSKLVFLYGFTSTPGRSLSGISVIPGGVMELANVCGDTESAVNRALAQLAEKPFVRFDLPTNTLWVVNRIKYLTPLTKKRAHAIVTHVSLLPASPLKKAFKRKYDELLREACF